MYKVAFHLGPFTVHWYGVLVALGFLAGLWTASRRAIREGILPEKVLDLGPWLIAGTIIGARIFYVVGHWEDEFSKKPFTEVFMVQRGGLVFYGGLIGATLLTLAYMLKQHLPVWKFGDVLAPEHSTGIFLWPLWMPYERLLLWAAYGPAMGHPVSERTRDRGVPVHPTQIYESLLSLGLYAGLAWLYRRKRFDGQVFATYLMCYAVLRSIVEVFRGDYPTYYFGGYVTPAHIISVGIFMTGLIIYFALPRRGPVAKTA